MTSFSVTRGHLVSNERETALTEVGALQVTRPEDFEKQQHNDKRRELHDCRQGRGRWGESGSGENVVDRQSSGLIPLAGDEQGHEKLVEDDDKGQQDARGDARSKQRQFDSEKGAPSAGSEGTSRLSKTVGRSRKATMTGISIKGKVPTTYAATRPVKVP